MVQLGRNRLKLVVDVGTEGRDDWLIKTDPESYIALTPVPDPSSPYLSVTLATNAPIPAHAYADSDNTPEYN